MMTNLMPSQILNVGNTEIHTVQIYIYLGHEVRIGRYNQTAKLSRRTTLGCVAYGKLYDEFKSAVPITLKYKSFEMSCPNLTKTSGYKERNVKWNAKARRVSETACEMRTFVVAPVWMM